MYPKCGFRCHSEPHLGSGCGSSGQGGDPTKGGSAHVRYRLFLCLSSIHPSLPHRQWRGRGRVAMLRTPSLPRTSPARPHDGHPVLVDEVRARRGQHRYAARRRHLALDGRSQLSGTQLHARPYAHRRRRAVLPLVLSAARHRWGWRKSARPAIQIPRSSTPRAITTTPHRSRKRRAGCWST